MWKVASVAAMVVLALVGGFNALPSAAGIGGASSAACSDPRFKAAELAAYRALVKAQEEAARVLADAITALEKQYRDKEAREDQRYRQGLLACNGDAACMQNSTDYHNLQVPHLQKEHDKDLRILRDNEAKAKEDAKNAYDEAVDNAREQFCGGETSNKAEAKRIAAEQRRVELAIARVVMYASSIR